MPRSHDREPDLDLDEASFARRWADFRRCRWAPELLGEVRGPPRAHGLGRGDAALSSFWAAANAVDRGDAPLVTLCRDAADKLSGILASALSSGRYSTEDLFDDDKEADISSRRRKTSRKKRGSRRREEAGGRQQRATNNGNASKRAAGGTPAVGMYTTSKISSWATRAKRRVEQKRRNQSSGGRGGGAPLELTAPPPAKPKQSTRSDTNRASEHRQAERPAMQRWRRASRLIRNGTIADERMNGKSANV